MTTSNSSARITFAQKSFITLVCIIGPLATSAMMGASFLKSLDTGVDSLAILVGAVSILASSAVLGWLTTKCYQAAYHKTSIACALTWLIIVFFSTSSSALSLLDGSRSTITKQVQSTSENRSLNQSIEINNQIIASYMQQVNSHDPVKWKTKREGWLAEVSKLETKNENLALQKSHNEKTGKGSSVADSFSKVERFGITRETLILLFAVALDAVPFIAGLAIGALSGPRRRDDEIEVEVTTEKKHQRPNLQAV